MKWRWAVVLCLLSAGSAVAEQLSHGRFRDLAIYRPAGDVRRVVLFLSAEDGWTASTAEAAEVLADEGALVAGIDTPALFRELERDDAQCVYPDGDLENLGHFLEAYYRLPTYRPPILMGVGTGGAFAYAMLAQAPVGTFAGAISLDFCPRLTLAKPLCKGEGLQVTHRASRSGVDLLPKKNLTGPWVVVHAAQDPQCSAAVTQNFVAKVGGGAELMSIAATSRATPVAPEVRAAMHRITARLPDAPLVPVEVGDLPIVEVPASGTGDTFAVILSGDGGWAGLDKALAAAFAARGVPVVGLDSLRYFWRPRTPQSTASDVDRLVRHYSSAWQKSSVILIGYSQGADVLPFVANRLSVPVREKVRLLALLGVESAAQFEFRLSNWLGGDDSGLPIEPEIERIAPLPVLCVYGEGEAESLCPKLSRARVKVEQLPGGHHFDGDYDRLSAWILKELSRTNAK